VLTTETFSGTTIRNPNGVCSGDSHNFTAQEGDISVRLIATSDPVQTLSVQVCPGVDVANTCTLPQQKINVGQTLTAPRKTGSAQNLKLLGYYCVYGGTVNPNPVTYTVSVTYMK